MRHLLFTFVVAALLVGCAKEESVLPTQREKIEQYLQTRHRPALIPVEQVEEGSDLDTYYTTAGSTVYRYIWNVNNPDRLNQAEVTPSSSVWLTFQIYPFDSYNNIPSTQLPLYTNDASLREAYIEEGLNIDEWKFVPQLINLSQEDILPGLRYALIGCRSGDVVEAYMTSNMAYGDMLFSLLPKECPLYIYFEVGGVN